MLKFEPTLAHPRNEGRVSFTENNYYVQPKLDGIRCYITKYGMFTRNHKVIVSCPHIQEDLKEFFNVYGSDVILDGELYNHSLKNDFEKIVSLVRKSKPTEETLAETKAKVQFHNYDCYCISHPKAIFTDRYEFLERFTWGIHDSIRAVQTVKVESMEEVNIINKQNLDAGYEGSMLRTDKSYDQKRSWNLQKVKSFKDEEATIIGYVEGKGKLLGKLGKFLMELADGTVFGCPPSSANFEERTTMWENRESYIGKEATYIYFEKTKRGVPRFPKFKSLRNYE